MHHLKASLAGACLVSVVLLGVTSPSRATVISARENPNLFGNLNQADTNCPNVACGPTAAVNSFIYLQNEFPNVYDHKLVPAATKTISQYQQMINVANSLGTNDYMNTCGCGTGTFIEEFIAGKQKYIDAMAMGTTTYAAQMTSKTWRNMPGMVNVGPQPAYVQLNTAPTIQFLADQLRMGEDVELFINGGNKNNHYVTLTKIYYNDAKGGKRYIDIVDPNQPTKGGPAGPPAITQVPITGMDPADNDILLGDLAYLGPAPNIVNAVSESPNAKLVPEPPGIWPFGLGLVMFGLLRARRRA